MAAATKTTQIGTDPIIVTGESRGKESVMDAFVVTVSFAQDAEYALGRVAKRLPEGFKLTGRTSVRDERKMMIDVEVENLGGDRNNCWVILTSYGMSPSAGLGSHWEELIG